MYTWIGVLHTEDNFVNNKVKMGDEHAPERWATAIGSTAILNILHAQCLVKYFVCLNLS